MTISVTRCHHFTIENRIHVFFLYLWTNFEFREESSSFFGNDFFFVAVDINENSDPFVISVDKQKQKKEEIVIFYL